MSRLTADALAHVGEGDYDDEDANAVDDYEKTSSSGGEAAPAATGQPESTAGLDMMVRDEGGAADSSDTHSESESVQSEDERIARTCDSSRLEERVFKLARKLSSLKNATASDTPESPHLAKNTSTSSAPHGQLSDTVWYFSYGSNMNVAQLLTRLGPFIEKKLMALDNHRLTFNKKVSLKRQSSMNATNNLGFANVEPCAGETVYGIAYLVHTHQVELMDVFEGVSSGHYFRKTVMCRDSRSGQLVPCEVYFAEPQAIGENLLPTAAYMSHLLAGRSMLPAEYLQMLQKHPVAEEKKRAYF